MGGGIPDKLASVLELSIEKRDVLRLIREALPAAPHLASQLPPGVALATRMRQDGFDVVWRILNSNTLEPVLSAKVEETATGSKVVFWSAERSAWRIFGWLEACVATLAVLIGLLSTLTDWQVGVVRQGFWFAETVLALFLIPGVGWWLISLKREGFGIASKFIEELFQQHIVKS